MTDLDFSTESERLRAAGALRTLHTRAATGGKYRVEGREVLNFSSNDYLDLANDERVKAMAGRAVAEYGCGATASRLMSGHLAVHERFEKRLARLVGREASLVFGSGFLANLGVISALAGRGDLVFADRLSHASLVDGIRLSGARLFRYRHNDTDHLETLLRKRRGDGRRLMVTESLFSMDGDLAPLEDLCRIAKHHDCTLIVDEAHAIGVFGPRGAGICSTLRAAPPHVIVGTLSKSLGGYGGFVAGSDALREHLVNHARTFIYSTGLPPACVGSALGALSVLDESPRLGEALLARAACFRELLADRGFDIGVSCSQIVPILVGGNDKTVAFSGALEEDGIIAVPIRPPTVPTGASRLRLSVTLAHENADLESAADRLANAAKRVGVLS